MRTILTLLSCFILGSLSAEMIGSIEYHLPNEGKGWKVGDELHSDNLVKSTTLVYIPENTDKATANESFAVHVNNLPSGPADEASLEKPIQLQFPDKKVKVNILDKNEESVLYEWTVADAGQEKVHGWTRGFSKPEETVMLIYLTDQMNQVENARPIWLQALKNAKSTQ